MRFPLAIALLLLAAPQVGCGQAEGESSASDEAPAEVNWGSADWVVSTPDSPSSSDSSESGLPESVDQTPHRVGGEVVPPVRLSGEEPKWSQSECRWPGVIILETIVNAEGRVSSVRFLKQQPPDCIQLPIREALATWRFKPAELHGEPVAVYYNMTVSIHWQ